MLGAEAEAARGAGGGDDQADIGGPALMVFFPEVTTLVPVTPVSIVIPTVTVGAGHRGAPVGDKGALPLSPAKLVDDHGPVQPVRFSSVRPRIRSQRPGGPRCGGPPP